MQFKKYIGIIACIVGAFIFIFGGGRWVSVIGVSIVYACFIGELIYNFFRWNVNKRDIKSEYVSINIENIILDVFILFITYSNIKDTYKDRVFNYKYFHDEIIEINNFKDFLNTYDGTEKILLYMTMGVIIVGIISIIQKIVCRGRVSSEQILLSNGEIIKIKDIKYIKVDNALWRFSKKVTITLESDKRVIYIKNKLFTRVEKTLINTISNSI